MLIQDILLWHIYKCPKCNLSDPPKDKYVVIVCKQKDSVSGFFINSNIPTFIQANPKLANSQVKIDPSECSPILTHTSFIGCNDLKDFYDWEITRHYCQLSVTTKGVVIAAVEASITISPEKIQRIKKQASSST